MWVNRHQTSSEVYAKLATKYEQLDAIDQKQSLEKTQKKDRFEISGSSNVDQNDYQRVLDKFKSADANIRAHEQAHAASGATKTPIQYNYQMGPDGKMYAVGGSVRLDTSIPTDPKEAAFKLDQIANAASAPDAMSGADAHIATQANLMKMMLQIQGDKDANL
ncbi:MAG: putative metalloprotease CJM1_0395 family protein [Campylobacterota bacterium]|nr:putative metalloprotease CJM1_0395 family protein [Campylobacterota bacterium]